MDPLLIVTLSDLIEESQTHFDGFDGFGKGSLSEDSSTIG